ncbi:MAG TPA: hypothetical protein VMC85_01435 [Desulfomonilaceae bacterium]|nr:hypothetical protein [Desulfomonilaceae bacterium]
MKSREPTIQVSIHVSDALVGSVSLRGLNGGTGVPPVYWKMTGKMPVPLGNVQSGGIVSLAIDNHRPP